MDSQSASALSGTLSPRLLKAPKPHKARSLRIPGLGRVILTSDPGTGRILASDAFATSLSAVHRDGDGKVKDVRDFGSGNVQTNFVVGLMWDALGTTSDKGAPVFATNSRYMYSGTGSTVNDYDYQLATTAGPASGSITPTFGFGASGGAPAAQLQYVGTINYTSTLAITEWGLFNDNAQGAISSSTTNTPTATGTSASAWNNAPSAIGAWGGYVCVATSASPVVGGFVLTNSTNTTSSLITIGSGSTGWYDLNSNSTLAAGTTPSSNSTLGIYPLMFDHKTFSVINVVNGDSIQFTYTLSIVAGG